MFNYFNKNELFEKIKEDDLEFNTNKGNLTTILGDLFIKNKNKIYGSIICLGNYLSRSIYTFTNCNHNHDLKSNLSPRQKLNSNLEYLLKFCQILIKTFPSYSKEYLLYHLYSRTGISDILTLTEFSLIQKQVKNENKMTPLEKFKQQTEKFGKSIKNGNESCKKIMSTETLINKNDNSHFINTQKVNNISLKRISKIDNSQTKKNSTLFLTNNLTVPPEQASKSTKNVFVVTRDRKLNNQKSDNEESITSESFPDMISSNYNKESYLTPKKSK